MLILFATLWSFAPLLSLTWFPMIFPSLHYSLRSHHSSPSPLITINYSLSPLIILTVNHHYSLVLTINRLWSPSLSPLHSLPQISSKTKRKNGKRRRIKKTWIEKNRIEKNWKFGALGWGIFRTPFRAQKEGAPWWGLFGEFRGDDRWWTTPLSLPFLYS